MRLCSSAKYYRLSTAFICLFYAILVLIKKYLPKYLRHIFELGNLHALDHHKNEQAHLLSIGL